MPEYTDVSAAVIKREGKVLIARRASGPRAGLWEFPGGKKEENESLESCLAREIREELGLEITVKRPFMTVEHTYPDICVRLHCFFCGTEQAPGELTAHHEIKWVSPGELAEFRFPEADQLVAEKLLAPEPEFQDD